MGLNPSKLSKQNRDEFEFTYKPKPTVSYLIPTDVFHEIASFMTLKEIINNFSRLSKELRNVFLLNPNSPHWKVVNLSDEILFGDSQMKYLIRVGAFLCSEVIILRRTNITSHSMDLLSKLIHRHPENRLALVDIRGCYKISRKSKKILQSTKPSIQLCTEKRRDYFECNNSIMNESIYIFDTSSYFSRMAKHTDNIIYYGSNVAGCDCDYCCSVNVKMKCLLTIFGPFYLDVLVGTFNYEFFDRPTIAPVVDCFCPIFGTSIEFLLSGHTLYYILKKLWRYRMVCSTEFDLVYRKYTNNPILVGEEEMYTVECYCDRYGPIIVVRNDNIGVIANICKFGAVFTSFDASISIGNAIKACRWLSCCAHLDLVEIA